MNKNAFDFEYLEISQFGMRFNQINRQLISAETEDEWGPAVRAMTEFLQILDQKLISSPEIIAAEQIHSSRAFSMLLTLKDLQSILPTLPEQVILLADHPILFPPDDWPQIKLDMGRVSYLAARYHPFFEIDAYDRLVDQSDFAYALRDYILLNREMPTGLYAYSSQTLIIITGAD